MTKTNAARILDKQGIKYELLAYEVDESDLSATSVAAKLGQNIEQVFKTLVLRGDKTGIFVCVIPGGEELDLKKAAQASGNKNAVMVPVKEILELTRVHSWRMFPSGHEEKISNLYRRKLYALRFYICQCRNTGITIKNSAE